MLSGDQLWGINAVTLCTGQGERRCLTLCQTFATFEIPIPMSVQDPSAIRLSDPSGEKDNPRGVIDEQETSREEVRSIKAELAKVNSELKVKADELAHIHSDLSNLMASTAIAAVVLDRTLAIRRYTPGAMELFNLIPADLGRPVSHLKHPLDYPGLTGDAEEVLRTLVPVERLVSDETRWFQVRLQPYRAPEGVISGVVLALEDVTERQEAADVLRLDLEATTLLSEVSLRLIPGGDIQAMLDAILDAAIIVMRADAGTVQLYDRDKETLTMPSHHGIPSHVVEHFAEVSAESRSPCGRALESGRRVTTLFDSSLPDPTGDNRWHREEAGLLSAQSTPLIARDGCVLGMLSTHWKVSHFPNDRELRFFDLLTRLAADVIERQQSDELMRGQREELQRHHAVAVERESRIIQLESDVNELLARLGEAPP